MNFCLLVLLNIITFKISYAESESTICGDWTPYKDEKCFKVVSTAGPQTYEDAEVVCGTFAAELHRESYPRLITIKSEEEQHFLQNFLFRENEVLDHVWLGLKQMDSGSDFEWNDGSKILFSNWANQSVAADGHRCVEMESGEGLTPAGLWVKVNCKKKNAVVCERRQTWSLETLQNMFLNHKVQVGLELELAQKKIGMIEQNNSEAEKKIGVLEEGKIAAEEIITMLQQRNMETEKTVHDLKQNPVPVSFIYVQLANQAPPTTLWPQTNWTEVTSSYAGLFFRVGGGTAAPFGQVQEASTTRLEQIEYKGATQGQMGCDNGINTLPPDGSWTKRIYSGRNGGEIDMCLRFRLSNAEVKPRNQAVKVWQRKG